MNRRGVKRQDGGAPPDRVHPAVRVGQRQERSPHRGRRRRRRREHPEAEEREGRQTLWVSENYVI